MKSAGMPLPKRLERQWLICAIAAIGFAFDIYELLMLPLIVKPAIAALSAPLVQSHQGGMTPADAAAAWAPGGPSMCAGPARCSSYRPSPAEFLDCSAAT